MRSERSGSEPVPLQLPVVSVDESCFGSGCPLCSRAEPPQTRSPQEELRIERHAGWVEDTTRWSSTRLHQYFNAASESLTKSKKGSKMDPVL